MPYTTLENLLRPSTPHDDAAILAHVIEIPSDATDHDNNPALKMLVINCYSLSQVYIDNLLTSALLTALINRTSPNLIFINGVEELSSDLNKNILESFCNIDKNWIFTSKEKTILCFPSDTIELFETMDLDKTLYYDFFYYDSCKPEEEKRNIHVNLFVGKSTEHVLPYQMEHHVHMSLLSAEPKFKRYLSLFITDTPGSIALYRSHSDPQVCTAEQALVFQHADPSPYRYLNLLDHKSSNLDLISPQIQTLSNFEQGLQRLLGGILTQCRWRFDGRAQDMCILLESSERSIRWMNHIAKTLGLAQWERHRLSSSQDAGLVFESIFVPRTQLAALYSAILLYPQSMSAMLLKWIEETKSHMRQLVIPSDRYNALEDLKTKLQQRRFQATAGILTALDAWCDQYQALIANTQEKPKSLREQSWKHFVTLKLHEVYSQSQTISEEEQRGLTLWSPGNPLGCYLAPKAFIEQKQLTRASTVSSSSSLSDMGGGSSSSSSSSGLSSAGLFSHGPSSPASSVPREAESEVSSGVTEPQEGSTTGGTSANSSSASSDKMRTAQLLSLLLEDEDSDLFGPTLSPASDSPSSAATLGISSDLSSSAPPLGRSFGSPNRS